MQLFVDKMASSDGYKSGADGTLTMSLWIFTTGILVVFGDCISILQYACLRSEHERCADK